MQGREQHGLHARAAIGIGGGKPADDGLLHQLAAQLDPALGSVVRPDAHHRLEPALAAGDVRRALPLEPRATQRAQRGRREHGVAAHHQPTDLEHDVVGQRQRRVHRDVARFVDGRRLRHRGRRSGFLRQQAKAEDQRDGHR